MTGFLPYLFSNKFHTLSILLTSYFVTKTTCQLMLHILSLSYVLVVALDYSLYSSDYSNRVKEQKQTRQFQLLESQWLEVWVH